MNLSQEWLLALLLLALYLHDSVTLTGPDTAFLVRSGRAGWMARFPTRQFTLSGKHLFLPPLLPPASPVFALHWAVEARPAGTWTPEDASAFLRPISLASAFSFLAVLVILPLVLVTRPGTAPVLASIAFAYVTVLASVTALWLVRAKLKLTTATCGRLTAEMLLCPPVAANLTRRISQPMQMNEGFIPAARRLLSGPEWEQARQGLQARLALQLEEVEPGSPEHRQLQTLQAQLT